MAGGVVSRVCERCGECTFIYEAVWLRANDHAEEGDLVGDNDEERLVVTRRNDVAPRTLRWATYCEPCDTYGVALISRDDYLEQRRREAPDQPDHVPALERD